MQQGYRYVLVAPIGRNFDPDFRPELPPPEMLRLGDPRGCSADRLDGGAI